jgi:hypothetical protein
MKSKFATIGRGSLALAVLCSLLAVSAFAQKTAGRPEQ